MSQISDIFSVSQETTQSRTSSTVIKHLTDIHAKSMASSPESLRDALLRDAILNIADNESKVCQIMLNNINTYIEVVHTKATLQISCKVSGMASATSGSDNTIQPWGFCLDKCCETIVRLAYII